VDHGQLLLGGWACLGCWDAVMLLASRLQSLGPAYFVFRPFAISAFAPSFIVVVSLVASSSHCSLPLSLFTYLLLRFIILH